MLALLLSSTLLLAPAPAGAPPEPRDLRTSSLELRVGVVRGATVTRMPRRLLVGYDWNRREFRSFQWDRGVMLLSEDASHLYEATGEQFTVSVLTADEFGALMDGIVERGLAYLPLEVPAGGEDVYGRHTTLAIHHQGVLWENQAPSGCVRVQSRRQPTPTQQEAFDQILAHAWESASNATAHAGTPLDAYSIPVFRNRGEAELLVVAAQAVADDPALPLLDLNRPQFSSPPRRWSTRNTETGRMELGHWNGRVSFPWHWDQPAGTLGRRPGLYTARPVGWVEIVEGEPSEVTVKPPWPAQLEDQRRRAALAQEQTDLTLAERSQIQAGWVLPGCSGRVALAVLGEPELKHQDSWIYRRTGRLLFVKVTPSDPTAGD